LLKLPSPAPSCCSASSNAADAAPAALSQAATALDEIGSPLWAARAHRELQRLTNRSVGSALTDAERQVAEKAAAGLSNKYIAATLYLPPKTTCPAPIANSASAHEHNSPTSKRQPELTEPG
jgi:hypothetical protein